MKFSVFAPRSLGEVGSVSKWVFIFFIFFSSFLLFFKSPVFAQSTNYPLQNTNTQQYTVPNVNSGVPQNLHTLSQSLLIDIMSALSCQLAGVDPVNPSQKCLGVDQETGKIGFVENNGGAIGVMGNMIAMLYTPPVHTADYFRYLAGNFGITKGAYAQGVGFTSLSPLTGLWITFRNIVYLLFVLIFALIGLGIMLRMKIDPRTVMTIQNQIPKIVIGLILITFSFAIAGFLIDLMWVSIIVIVNLLTNDPPGGGFYVTTFGASGIVGGFLNIANNTAVTVGAGIWQTFFPPGSNNSLITLPASAADCGFLNLGCTIQNIVGVIVGALLTIVVGFFVWLVVIIAVIWALFKLWFALLKAYISILIDIIFAPFWIVSGLIPGSGEKVGFGPWIRDMAGNLAAFPVTIALFLIAKILMDGFKANFSTELFQPPLIGAPGTNFGGIIAFGIIMMLPKVVDMTKAAFKAGGGLGFGGASVGVAAAGALGGAIGSRLYRKDEHGNAIGPLANVGRNVGSWVSSRKPVMLAKRPFTKIASTNFGRRVTGGFKDQRPTPTETDAQREERLKRVREEAAIHAEVAEERRKSTGSDGDSGTGGTTL